MRLVVCHSPNERCGVRQYGLALDRSFGKRGVEVVATDFVGLVASRPNADVLLVHFEPSLVPIELKLLFMRELQAQRARGTRVVFCCHLWEPRIAEDYEALVDRFALHRTYPQASYKAVEIPLGCPTYEPPAGGREALRARLGLPSDRLVVTTVGFLTRWKRLPEAVAAVAESVGPSVLVWAQTPWPHDVDGSGAREEDARMRQVQDRLPKVHYVNHFTPEADLLDLVHASDLGFVYHPIDTGSVSAATKQFVSARCPLVVTGSSHASDLRSGVHRTGSFDLGSFAREVYRMASDLSQLAWMRRQMEAEYQRINMDAVAGKYLEVFR